MYVSDRDAVTQLVPIDLHRPAPARAGAAHSRPAHVLIRSEVANPQVRLARNVTELARPPSLISESEAPGPGHVPGQLRATSARAGRVWHHRLLAKQGRWQRQAGGCRAARFGPRRRCDDALQGGLGEEGVALAGGMPAVPHEAGDRQGSPPHRRERAPAHRDERHAVMSTQRSNRVLVAVERAVELRHGTEIRPPRHGARHVAPCLSSPLRRVELQIGHVPLPLAGPALVGPAVKATDHAPPVRVDHQHRGRVRVEQQPAQKALERDGIVVGVDRVLQQNQVGLLGHVVLDAVLHIGWAGARHAAVEQCMAPEAERREKRIQT
eukprot:scaffold25269_cov112-Isochrysis_galbana.AAC.1